jgi:hypothetical protein
MGQYHKLVNFTKKQFINPHEFGNGLKLREQICWKHSFSNVTHFVLARCSGRGGGDFESELAGCWGGDRVSLVGDYAEPGDFPFLSEFEFKEMMNDVWFGSYDAYGKLLPRRDSKGRFTSNVSSYVDISAMAAAEIGKEFGIEFIGDGWKDIKPLKGDKVEPTLAPDIVISSGR